MDTPQRLRQFIRTPKLVLTVGWATLLPLCLSAPVMAEGSFQLELRDGNPNSIPAESQGLLEYDSTYSGPTTSGITQKDRPIYVDVQAGEVINISACGRNNSDSVEVELFYHPPGTFDEFTSPPPISLTKVADTGTVGNNVSCTSPFNGVIANPLVRYDTDPSVGGEGTGTYEVRLFNRSQNGNNGTLSRFDVTLTPDTSTNPDPRLNQGRLWSYIWGFRGSSFAQTHAADTNYHVPVPGGFPGTNYVWRLDLNNFAGFAYEIIANELGVDSPNTAGDNVAGLSVPINGNSATPQYKVYLSYPTLNIDPVPTQAPTISNLRFEDNAGVNSTFTPGTTSGIQDTGFFRFTADAEGTYNIIIDTDDGNGNGPDGIYGVGDVSLLGTTQANVETAVEWDGKDIDGNVLPLGTYNAQVQVRLGEYHFVATDAETSGGGAQNGLTIFQAFLNGGTANTRVFWDDITGLGNPPGGTTTLPNGALSNTSAGKHTWGNFTSSGFGDLRHIDTYVYGSTNSGVSTAVIEATDTVSTDYGDAPDTYGTDNQAGNSSNSSDPSGAEHTIVSGLYLGANAPDAEADAATPLDGSGDGTDEDGITLPTLRAGDTTYTIPAASITATNMLNRDATLHAWIDFDQSGTFDPGEYQSVAVASSTNNDNPAGNLEWTGLSGITTGTTYARFRLTTDAGIITLTPGGSAQDGEVEDYQIEIQTSSTPPPVIGPGDGNACLLTHHTNSGVAADPNRFYEITDHTNPATLSEIGPWNVPSGTVEGLTANVSTGTVYALNANRSGALYLGIIDPATGSFTDISTTGMTTLSHTTHGTLNVVQTRAMAHQPGTNIIWAAAYDTQPTTGPGNNFYYLFKIDATTGAAITDAFGLGNDYLAIDLSPYETVRSTQSATIEALTFYQGNPNFLYGVVSTDRGGRSTNIGHLFTVDVSAATPTATLAPQNLSGTAITGGNAPVSTIYDIEGMSFDDNNDLVIVSSNVGGANANSLFFVNTATGAAFGKRSIISGDWEGIVCNTPSPVASDPNVLLVKRITAINGNRIINPNDSTALNTVVDGGTANDDDNHPNWPNNYLVGEINAGLTKPGDEIEYTIYFLSTGGKEAVEVTICDRTPDFQTFVPDTFNSVPPSPGVDLGTSRGTLVEYNGNAFSHSNDDDSDIAQYYPSGSTPLPTVCNNAPAQTEDNGAVVVDLGNLPNATGLGTPNTSYGAIRFRANVK